MEKKRSLAASVLVATLWSITSVISQEVGDVGSSFGVLNVIKIIGLSAGLSFILYILFRLIVKYETNDMTESRYCKKRWLIYSGLFFAMWLPWFLLYFPGNLTIDSIVSIEQAMGLRTLSNNHPVAFTLLVKLCLKIGQNPINGIVIFSILQMLIMALIFGGAIEWMRMRKIPGWLRIASSCFFAFSPINALYSFTMWKDILFSGWLVVLTIVLIEFLCADEKKASEINTLVKLAVLSILVSFSRNNGIYIIITLGIGLVLFYKGARKELTVCFFCTILFILGIQGPVYDQFGIEKGSFVESLGVPLQQIGYTVSNEGNITAEQREFLEQILPLEDMKNAYNGTMVNTIKLHPNFNNEFLEENKVEFLKVWFEMLPSNFGNYVKSYVLLTRGYWDMTQRGYTFAFGAESYEKDFIFGDNVKQRVQEIVEEKCNRIPIVNLFFRPGVPIWVLLGAIAVLWIKKESRLILALLPVVMVWVTIMVATPISGEFRYIYSLYITMPVAFGITYLKGHQRG